MPIATSPSNSARALAAAKVEQAAGILNELGIDAWLTFVRETTESGDPVLPIILGQSLTWQSALVVTAKGDTVAIVGTHDADAVRSTGAWHEVVGYVQGIGEPLRELLDRLAPRHIAINESTDDVKADGLTVGMYKLLLEHLSGTSHAGTLVSAANVIRALRGRKLPAEIERLRTAIAGADTIFDRIDREATPGLTEAAVAGLMHGHARDQGWELAWDRAGCPIVTTGPDSMGGHGVPSTTLAIRPGNVFHLDFGVRIDDYCSDLQRSWYVCQSGESRAPDDVQRAFDAVLASIDAAAAALRPGVECRAVDAAARSTLVSRGYPEYTHATGHEVGRAAHDGGGVLGPTWERYGKTPFLRVESGNVFTLELGVDVPGRGYLGLEEMVVVTDNGCAPLSTPQRAIKLLG
ncbi:MAG: aminopeptidase P family protein [Phycisphaerales bacterium]|nr:aminopeptidase P family protein [Phycisphaerales bacterium]